MCVRNQVTLFESEMEPGKGNQPYSGPTCSGEEQLLQPVFWLTCTGTIFWKVFYLTLRAKVKSGDVAMFGVLDAHT